MARPTTAAPTESPRSICHCFLASTTSMAFFFFQAEDGIRDATVTGVQTCALPIFRRAMNTLQNRNILLVDDMPSMHEDFRKILAARPAAGDLDDVEAALFGQAAPLSVDGFELDSAYQGHEGVAKVEASVQAGRPYAMAFVDMRMPPGWDGVETIERLWRVDPQVQIVICTAYS